MSIGQPQPLPPDPRSAVSLGGNPIPESPPGLCASPSSSETQVSGSSPMDHRTTALVERRGRRTGRLLRVQSERPTPELDDARLNMRKEERAVWSARSLSQCLSCTEASGRVPGDRSSAEAVPSAFVALASVAGGAAPQSLLPALKATGADAAVALRRRPVGSRRVSVGCRGWRAQPARVGPQAVGAVIVGAGRSPRSVAIRSSIVSRRSQRRHSPRSRAMTAGRRSPDCVDCDWL